MSIGKGCKDSFVVCVDKVIIVFSLHLICSITLISLLFKRANITSILENMFIVYFVGTHNCVQIIYLLLFYDT